MVLGFSRSLRLQALWAAPRYSLVMWQWSRTESPTRGLSHTWHVSAVRKASQSSRVILIAFGSASTSLILLSSSCSDFKRCFAASGRGIRLVAPSGRYTAPRCSNSCKPHGVAFSGYCFLRGRARTPQPWW